MMNFLQMSSQYFNPMTLIGLGLVMHIEAVIEYLKKQWALPGQAAPFVASVLAFLVQMGIVWIWHVPISDTLIGTIFTAAGACFWHELSSPSTPTVINNSTTK